MLSTLTPPISRERPESWNKCNRGDQIPESHWAHSLHIYTKAHSKKVHNYTSGSRAAFPRQHPLSFDSRLISAGNALSNHCAGSCTALSRQKSSTFHFQAWRVETKGSTPFRKPCHVLWKSQRSRAVQTISEQHSGLFLLTVIALTAPEVGKEINIPLLVSQLYFPHSLKGPSQLLQVKWIPYQLQLLPAWKSIPALGADIPWDAKESGWDFTKLKNKKIPSNLQLAAQNLATYVGVARGKREYKYVLQGTNIFIQIQLDTNICKFKAFSARNNSPPSLLVIDVNILAKQKKLRHCPNTHPRHSADFNIARGSFNLISTSTRFNV